MSYGTLLAGRSLDETETDEFRKQWEWLDDQLTASRDYLTQLEEVPMIDELAIAIARNQVLKHKHDLAKAIAGEG
jgi:hypothetical protein